MTPTPQRWFLIQVLATVPPNQSKPFFWEKNAAFEMNSVSMNSESHVFVEFDVSMRTSLTKLNVFESGRFLLSVWSKVYNTLHPPSGSHMTMPCESHQQDITTTPNTRWPARRWKVRPLYTFDDSRQVLNRFFHVVPGTTEAAVPAVAPKNCPAASQNDVMSLANGNHHSL